MAREVVLAGAVRTPFGRFGGVLKDHSSVDLAAIAIREALSRANVPATSVDQVLLGLCMQAEAALQTNIVARQALLQAGLPPETLSLTLDRACCSSLTAVHLATKDIQLGDAQTVVAAGVDNMSRVPLLAPEARWGTRIGHMTLIDPLFELGYRAYNPVAVDAGEVAVEYGVGRDEQDAWAVRSQRRYACALAEGKLAAEIVPVAVPQPKGPALILDKDEQPRPEATLEQLGKLPVVYGSPTVTAGNAPGLNSGAAAMLVMSEESARDHGVEVLGRIVANASVAGPPRQIATIPALALQKALHRADLALDDLDLIEINEAFAAVPLVSSLVLAGGDRCQAEALRERINVNGGSVAIGHPVGASGARLLLTALYELRRRGGGRAAVAICGGLSQGDATIVEA
ncbi:MAG: thiolase family protein [Chloroflexi bacterium]|nr:thiolase family protein [Chloroflexota bacterium]